MNQKSGENIAILGLVSNIGLTLVKGVSGVLGNSYLLIADAIESATDIVSSIIIWLGIRHARKPPDANHPYGHGKIEPMAGLAVSLLLVFVIVELGIGAIRRIQNPEIHIPEFWTLYILIGVIIIKGGLFLRGIVIGKSLQSTAIQADAYHHLSDMMTTGIGFLGTCIALFGGPNLAKVADWAVLGIVIYMCCTVYRIGLPAIRELLDEVGDPNMEKAIREHIAKNTHVIHTNLCIVRKSGFDRIVELHLLVDGEISVRDGHRIAHEVEAEIKKHFRNVQSVLVHIEPSYEIVS